MTSFSGYHVVFGSRNRGLANVNPAFLNASQVVPPTGTPPPYPQGKGNNSGSIILRNFVVFL